MGMQMVRPTIGYDRFGSLADMSRLISDVGSMLESGHSERRNQCPLSAPSGHAGAPSWLAPPTSMRES
jgi:hypothetical protein